MGIAIAANRLAVRIMGGLVASICALSLTACSTGRAPQFQTSDTGWMLVDDFERNSLTQWTLADPQNETEPFVADPQISVIVSESAQANRYLLRKPAADGIVGNRKALAWRRLPTPVAASETATIFTRINVESFPNNHSFGLSNQSAEQIIALAYDAFEPMIRITDKAESDGSRNDGTLMVLTGHKAYARITNPQTGRDAEPLREGQWYNIWFVVNNAPVAAGGQTYDVFVQGGEFAQRTLVFEGARFRMGRAEPLTHFIAIANTGPQRAPYGNGGVAYDDIYLAKGVNLTSPLKR